MKEYIKENFALVAAFGLPILIIVLLAASAYLPALFLHTNYNFVYVACTEGSRYYPYHCDAYLQQRFSVEGDRLVVHEVDMTQDLDKDGRPDIRDTYAARIFLHDTEKNESREITVEEAQSLTLHRLLTSPDGVSVSSRYDGNNDIFLLFDSGSSYGYYLTKGSSRSRLNLIHTVQQPYYPDDFRFIGWVLPGRS